MWENRHPLQKLKPCLEMLNQRRLGSIRDMVVPPFLMGLLLCLVPTAYMILVASKMRIVQQTKPKYQTDHSTSSAHFRDVGGAAPLAGVCLCLEEAEATCGRLAGSSGFLTTGIQICFVIRLSGD